MTCRKIEDKYGTCIELSMDQTDFLALRPEQGTEFANRSEPFRQVKVKR
jgi:hypothetical protein